MGKFDLDFNDVAKVVYPDKNKIPVKGNENRMVRVAFDLFRLRDNPPEDLWQVQSDDDGAEFLVRTFSLPEDEITVKSSWSIIADNKQENLTIAYKNIPISKIACSQYDARTPKDIEILKKTLFISLSVDNKFVNKYFNSLPKIKKEALKELGLEADEEPEDNDPLHIGEALREDKVKEDHLAPGKEKRLEEIMKEFLDKDQNSDDSPFEEEPIKAENLDKENFDKLEMALKGVFEPEDDIMTSAPKEAFVLSKRSLIKNAENYDEIDRELAEVLGEEDIDTNDFTGGTF